MMKGRWVRRRLTCVSALLLSLLLAGSVLAASSRAAEVEAAMQAYARILQANDAAGLANFYTSDGELLNPGMDSLKGPIAIRTFLESFGDVHIESASMVAEHTDVWGDVALQWGSYAQRVALPGKPVTEYRGRFVAQWSDQGKGRWLIRRLLTQPS